MAVLFGFLTVPVLVTAVAGRWASSTLLDNGKFADKTKTIIAEPAVVSAMGKFIGEELMQIYEDNLDFSSSLPESLQDEGKIIEEALKAELTEQATSLVGSGPVQSTISELVTVFHAQMVDVLEDKQSTEPQAVSLNLVPVVTELMNGLRENGLLPKDLTIPVIEPSLPPAAQVAALSDALGMELPAEMGSVEVFSAEDVANVNDDLRNARDAVTALRLISWIALGGALVLILSMWYLTGSRRLAGIFIGATVTLAGTMGLVIGGRLPGLVADAIDDEVASEAVRSAITVLEGGLRTTNIVLLVVGALSMVAAVSGRRVLGRFSSGDTNTPAL